MAICTDQFGVLIRGVKDICVLICWWSWNLQPSWNKKYKLCAIYWILNNTPSLFQPIVPSIYFEVLCKTEQRHTDLRMSCNFFCMILQNFKSARCLCPPDGTISHNEPHNYRSNLSELKDPFSLAQLYSWSFPNNYPKRTYTGRWGVLTSH